MREKLKQQKQYEAAEQLAPPVLSSSSAFRIGPNRFDNPEVRRKAFLPGPGQYELQREFEQPYHPPGSRAGT